MKTTYSFINLLMMLLNRSSTHTTLTNSVSVIVVFGKYLVDLHFAKMIDNEKPLNSHTTHNERLRYREIKRFSIKTYLRDKPVVLPSIEL